MQQSVNNVHATKKSNCANTNAEAKFCKKSNDILTLGHIEIINEVIFDILMSVNPYDSDSVNTSVDKLFTLSDAIQLNLKKIKL